MKTLGRGAFGRTMLAEKNGEQFAMKQVDVASYPAANAVLDEALRLAQLDHEAIVRVHRQFLEPLPPDHRLWRAPNFLMTPHTAAAGPHLEQRRLDLTASCFLQGQA